jgi:hypothetical protein
MPLATILFALGVLLLAIDGGNALVAALAGALITIAAARMLVLLVAGLTRDHRGEPLC